jgi:hypothetical protein
MTSPRLLDVADTAAYLGGISTSTVRSLVARGELTPVRMPSCRGRGESNRRLVFDRNDIDALIAKWKEGSTGAPNAGLSAAAVKGWKTSPTGKRKPRNGAAA